MILLLNKDKDGSVLSSCGRLFQRDTDDGIKEFAKSSVRLAILSLSKALRRGGCVLLPVAPGEMEHR